MVCEVTSSQRRDRVCIPFQGFATLVDVDEDARQLALNVREPEFLCME